MKNFNLIGILCIAVAAALFAIGVNETIHNGIEKSYFLFMFSLAGLFGFGLARNSLSKEAEKNTPPANPKSNKATTPSKKRKGK